MSLAASLFAAVAAGASTWSPATAPPLEACPAGGPPHVVFPSSSPQHATGAGAIVWDASPACPGGEGARVAKIGPGDVPGAPATPRTAAGGAIVPRGTLAVAGAPHGQIAIAGASAPSGGSGQARGSTRTLLIQGRSGGPFSRMWSEAGAATPLALATGYLGDVALASPPPAPAAGPSVHVERYYSNVLSLRGSAGLGPSPIATAPMTQMTLALDYRSDALAVWRQGGALYARDVPASGASRPRQLLARVGARVHISALLSDDNRATVAWAEDRAGRTSVYLDRSAVGVRFGAPRLLERVRDPDGLRSPAGSPSLVRLSTESVTIAWAGAASGRWAVRAAALGANGVGAATTVSRSSGDALLAALAPGPDGEALALWTEPRPSAAGGGANTNEQAIFSARGVEPSSARAVFGAPELVAPPGPNSDATVAIDPSSGRAVAAWRGEGGRVRYAIRGALSAAP